MALNRLQQIKENLDFNYWLDTHTRGCPQAWQVLWEQRAKLRKERREIVARIAEKLTEGKK